MDSFTLSKGSVCYEAFGAVGDGVADDLSVIVKAHVFAATYGLPVKPQPGATYHLGRRALTVIITTGTDWGNSCLINDDTLVENQRRSLISVQSLLALVS